MARLGCKIFPSKCDSVIEYVRLLNEHNAYEDFRRLREKTQDPLLLIKTLDKFSTTKDYDKELFRIIKKIESWKILTLRIKQSNKYNYVFNITNIYISYFYICYSGWLFNRRTSDIVCWCCCTYYCYGFSIRSW